MLEAGLDLLEQGLTVFDGELRLITWNKQFLQLLDFPEHLARPGAAFADVIHYNAGRGEYGPGDPEAQVAERVEAALAFKSHYTERIRPNGRIIAVRRFPCPTGASSPCSRTSLSSAAPSRPWSSPRRWRPSASSPAAWPTTSTTCSQ
jgi:PAS domain-containing protein